MSTPKILLAAALAAAIAAFFIFDLDRFLSLEASAAARADIAAFRAARPIAAIALYFTAYVTIAALSLPGATLITLVGGAIFGLPLGVAIVSVASTIGASLAFLSSRYLFRDVLASKYGDKLATLDAGVKRDGAFYLFTLRMIPAIPFFLINVTMGLTAMPLRTFAWVSQVGMLLGTIVFVNAGTQIASLQSLSGILSPRLLATFVVLGALGPVSHLLVRAAQRRRVYAPWRQWRPSRFDRNVVVVGAGSAGLVASYIAAALKAKVTLVERAAMGGDCLNTGCVPSKALLRSARFVADVNRARDFGMRSATVEFTFAEVMARVRRVIATIEPHDSVDRYTALGVECVRGHARLTSPWHVEVATAEGTRTLSARAIVIATGASPIVPHLPGLEDVHYVTSETIWNLEILPPRLVVLGGGPIGCELAQAFARLGSHVTIVEAAGTLMPREDDDAAALLTDQLVAEGVTVMTHQTAVACERVHGEQFVVVERDGVKSAVAFDTLLCALGRKPRTRELGLETLGLGVTDRGTLEVNEYLQTRYPHITACGDVAGPYQFTHMAAHQAYYAVSNALFGWLWRQRVDYRVVPWTTFTEPEIARVGLNTRDASAAGMAFVATRYPLTTFDRAVADEEPRGLVTVLTAPGTDRILGVTIVSARAGEMIGEFVTAMKHRLGLGSILGTIHAYPTWSDANKLAAGQWRRGTAPQWALGWLARLHAWRRRG